MFYNQKEYKLIGFEVSNVKNKMYNAVLKSTDKIVKVPFGDKRYQNYQDKTGLNHYQHLVHNDKKRRKRYRERHSLFLKPGFYSPGYFSYYYLW